MIPHFAFRDPSRAFNNWSTVLITTEESEVAKERNPYEGILYISDAAPERRFVATAVEGRKSRTLGYFESLEQAVAARDRYIEYHANKRFEPRKEYATYVDPNLETR
jgi:hypothetical protein